MSDTRELILERLLMIVGTIPNIAFTDRNNGDIPEDSLPAAIVFDGDEETDDRSDVSSRPANRPTLVQMVPEIVLAAQSGQAGTDLTTLRAALIRLVLTDVELNDSIVKTGRNGNGAIRYLGCRTDYGWMRSNIGGLIAQFMFKYVLRPDDL
jgi:hypothetical protein